MEARGKAIRRLADLLGLSPGERQVLAEALTEVLYDALQDVASQLSRLEGRLAEVESRVDEVESRLDNLVFGV